MNRIASGRPGLTLVSVLALAALLVGCSEGDADPTSTGTSDANRTDAASPAGPAGPTGQSSSPSEQPTPDPAPGAVTPSPKPASPNSPDAVKPTTPPSTTDDDDVSSPTPDGGDPNSADTSTSADASVNAPPDAAPTNDASAPAPAPAPTSDAAMGSPDPDVVRCDTRAVRCKRLAPTCPEGQVPRIIDTCYGECVDIDRCECDGPDACPDPDRFTCINSTQRCSYYLR